MKLILKIFILIWLILPSGFALGQSSKPNVDIYTAPRNGTFSVGSNFNVGVYINTKNQNINTISLDLRFDPKKLAIVKPTGGNSIMGVWIDAPVYDNQKGFLRMSGVIPEGINTNSGLITNISFKVLSAGDSQIFLNNTTEVLLNDGLGTKSGVNLFKSNLSFVRSEDDAVFISSDTHPFQDIWSNNNNPVFAWESGNLNILGYSIVLDNNPNTEPDLTIDTTEINKAYTNLQDGVHYFHVKANVNGVWSKTAHFAVRIDTTQPNVFKPSVNLLSNQDGIKQYILFFDTKDDTSGVEYYEVGVVNSKNQNALPVFIQTQSPYLLPLDTDKNSKILVRSFDNAGNLREVSVSVSFDARIIVFGIIGLLIVVLLILHYLLGHHIGRNLIRAYKFFKQLVKKDHEINNNQTE